MRKLLAVLAGVTLVCGLFIAMGQVIRQDGRALNRTDSGNTMDFIRVKRDQTINQKDRRKPERKPPPKEPPPPKLDVALDQERPTPDLQLDIPSMDLPRGATGGPFLGGMSSGSGRRNSGATPRITIEPQYPRDAAMRAIEGWVEVEFTVTEQGKVKDVKIVRAKPRKVFDRAARTTILKWSFHPKMVDGVAMSSRVSTVIEFKLD
ncbi:MAG: energy transducer TonB [Halieaceae bacterium]|jgi:periplasmic protein TonB|nr:energy transducer TonB [Halieaceae bacterium]